MIHHTSKGQWGLSFLLDMGNKAKQLRTTRQVRGERDCHTKKKAYAAARAGTETSEDEIKSVNSKGFQFFEFEFLLIGSTLTNLLLRPQYKT